MIGARRIFSILYRGGRGDKRKRKEKKTLYTFERLIYFINVGSEKARGIKLRQRKMRGEQLKIMYGLKK